MFLHLAGASNQTDPDRTVYMEVIRARSRLVADVRGAFGERASVRFPQRRLRNGGGCPICRSFHEMSVRSSSVYYTLRISWSDTSRLVHGVRQIKFSLLHPLWQAARNYQSDVILLLAAAELPYCIDHAFQKLRHRKLRLALDGIQQSALAKILFTAVRRFRDSVRVDYERVTRSQHDFRDLAFRRRAYGVHQI